MYIYGLTDPITQELRYIGYTSRSLIERFGAHLSPSKLKNKTHKNHWIKSLLRNNIKPEIFVIQETNEKEWKEDEQFNIAYFRSVGCRLTNQTLGGEGVLGHIVTDKTRKKISTSHLGNKNHMFGKKHKNETIKKMSMSHKKQKRTKEHNAKIAFSHIGIRPSDETLKKLSISHQKLNSTQINEVIDMIRRGITQNEIAKKFYVSTKTIRNIKANKHGYRNQTGVMS